MSNPAAQAFLQRQKEKGIDPQPAAAVSVPPSAVDGRVVAGAVLANAWAPRPLSKMEQFLAAAKQRQAEARKKAKEEAEKAEEEEEASDDDDDDDEDYSPDAEDSSSGSEDETVLTNTEILAEEGDASGRPKPPAIALLFTDMINQEILVPEEATFCRYGAVYLVLLEYNPDNASMTAHNPLSKSNSPAHPDNIITIDQLLALLRQGRTELMDPALLRIARALIVEKRKGFIPENVRGVYSKHNIYPPKVFPVNDMAKLKAYFESEGGYEWKKDIERQFEILSQCEAALRGLDEGLFQVDMVSYDLLLAGHVKKFSLLEQNWLCAVKDLFLIEGGYYDRPHVKAYVSEDQDSMDIGFTVRFPSDLLDEGARAVNTTPSGSKKRKSSTPSRIVPTAKAAKGDEHRDNDTEDE